MPTPCEALLRNMEDPMVMLTPAQVEAGEAMQKMLQPQPTRGGQKRTYPPPPVASTGETAAGEIVKP